MIYEQNISLQKLFCSLLIILLLGFLDFFLFLFYITVFNTWVSSVHPLICYSQTSTTVFVVSFSQA